MKNYINFHVTTTKEVKGYSDAAIHFYNILYFSKCTIKNKMDALKKSV